MTRVTWVPCSFEADRGGGRNILVRVDGGAVDLAVDAETSLMA